MELRAYWAVLIRRWWIIALVVAVVAAYVAYQYYHLHKTAGALKTYQSTVLVRVALKGNIQASDHNYADYVSAAETLADVYTTGPILSSNTFDAQVIQYMRDHMSDIRQHLGHEPDLGDNWTNPSAIGTALTASRAHSLVTVTTTWDTPDGAWAISHAVGAVTVANIGPYIDYVIRPATPTTSTAPATNALPVVSADLLSDASNPSIMAGPQANKQNLLLALLLVGLIIGIALAFFIEYLDDRIRTKYEVEQLLQLPVYGEIPHTPVPGKTSLQRS